MPDALHFSADGAWIAAGNAVVDVAAVSPSGQIGTWSHVSRDGVAPKWSRPGQSLVYTRHDSDGPLVHAALTPEGWKERELSPLGFNAVCAAGELWGGHRAAGGDHVIWWDGERIEDASAPALSASGVKAWLRHSTGELYVAGSAVDGPACRLPRWTGDWLVWERRGEIFARRPDGTVTPVLNVEPVEGAPVLLIASDGEIWLLTNGPRRTLLRPLGAHVGYELARDADQYFIDGVFVAPARALVAWSPERGGVHVEPVDTTRPRVNLRPPTGPIEDTSGVEFDALDYLIPIDSRRQRTGSHDMCWVVRDRLWYEMKFGAASKGDHWEAFSYDDGHVYLYEDRSQSEPKADPPLDYAWTHPVWCRRNTRVGDVIDVPDNVLIRFDPRTNRIVPEKCIPLPRRMTVLAKYHAIDCGGVIGVQPAILIEYWPLYPHGRPERNLYALGWGRVAFELRAPDNTTVLNRTVFNEIGGPSLTPTLGGRDAQRTWPPQIGTPASDLRIIGAEHRDLTEGEPVRLAYELATGPRPASVTWWVRVNGLERTATSTAAAHEWRDLPIGVHPFGLRWPGGHSARPRTITVRARQLPPTPTPEQPVIPDYHTQEHELRPRYEREFRSKHGAPAADHAALWAFRLNAERWDPEAVSRDILLPPDQVGPTGQQPVDPRFPDYPAFTAAGGEREQIYAAARAHFRRLPLGTVWGAVYVRFGMRRTLADTLRWVRGEEFADEPIAQDGQGPDRPTEPGSPSARRSGVVQLTNRVFVDAGGPWNALGTSFFWAIWGQRHDRERVVQNARFLAERGVDFVRVLGVVGPTAWRDRVVDPTAADYETVAGEAIDALWSCGVRTALTIFGGIDTVRDAAARRRVVEIWIRVIQSRPEAFQYVEPGNELYQNGIDPDEARAIARMLRDAIPHAVAVTAPKNVEGDAARWYKGSAANVSTHHPDRSQEGEGQLWRPVRQPWEVQFLDGIPPAAVIGEPIGPQSSIAADDDPLRLVMTAAVTWCSGNGGYVFHPGAGIRGGGAEDLERGRVSNFWEVAHVEATLSGFRALRAILPPDVANWQRANANDKFPAFPFEWQPIEQQRKDHRLLRMYAAVAGARFVALPLQTERGDVVVRPKRSARLEVFDPLSGRLLVEHIAGAGQDVVIPGNGGGTVIRGEFA